MRIGSIYSEAVTPTDTVGQEVREEQQLTEQQRLSQLATQRKIDHINWLNNPHTQLVLRELESKKNEFLNQALAEAYNYSKHNNHQNIIALLNQVNSINNTLNTYGRANNT